MEWKSVKLSYISLVGAFIAFIIILGSTLKIENHHAQFFERDPALSYYFNGDQVPSHMLHLITYPISYGIVVVFSVLSRKFDTTDFKFLDWFGCSSSVIPKKIFILVTFAIGLSCAILTTQSVTIIMKKIVGRPRPSAFYLCNYKGYADAVDSGNFTLYNSLTVTNAVGNVSNCYGSPDDAFSSFPSGHSSESFCCMVFTTLLLRSLLEISERNFMSAANLVAFAPIVISAWICVTRVVDNKHHVDDVIAGVIIGTVCSVLAYLTVDEWLEIAAREYNPVGSKKQDQEEGVEV